MHLQTGLLAQRSLQHQIWAATVTGIQLTVSRLPRLLSQEVNKESCRVETTSKSLSPRICWQSSGLAQGQTAALHTKKLHDRMKRDPSMLPEGKKSVTLTWTWTTVSQICRIRYCICSTASVKVQKGALSSALFFNLNRTVQPFTDLYLIYQWPSSKNYIHVSLISLSPHSTGVFSTNKQTKHKQTI